jgi:hypothetical protein
MLMRHPRFPLSSKRMNSSPPALPATQAVCYCVSGLAVDAGRRQQGLGRALMHRLMTDASLIEESTAELRVGVDTDKPSTEWLRQWYARLGFTEEVQSFFCSDYDVDEKEILMRKQIGREEREESKQNKKAE